jgi:HemY protein
LIRQYGFVQLQNVSLQLDRAEGWLKTRTDDPDLLSTLARLCIQLELWGKARSYLETVLDIEPSPIAYRLLGEVFARLGDDAAARRCQRDGLVLATEPPPTTSPAVVS